MQLQKIDRTTIKEYRHLEQTDRCYFFGEYAGGQGYNHSRLNQLIFNFKKPMSKQAQPDWKYKQQAIQSVSSLFYSCNAWSTLKNYLWVPVPPSKHPSDSEYDDRLTQVLDDLKQKEKCLDARDMLNVNTSRVPAHRPNSAPRPEPEDHIKNFVINQELIYGRPSKIAIFDDVITTGASFKAAQQCLQQTFPFAESPIGIFIARNVGTAINNHKL